MVVSLNLLLTYIFIYLNKEIGYFSDVCTVTNKTSVNHGAHENVFYSEKTPKQDNKRQTRDRYLMSQTSWSQSQFCSDHTVLLFPVAHDVYLTLSLTAANLHLTLSVRNTWQSLMSWLMSFNIKINKDNNIMFIIFITSLTF